MFGGQAALSSGTEDGASRCPALLHGGPLALSEWTGRLGLVPLPGHADIRFMAEPLTPLSQVLMPLSLCLGWGQSSGGPSVPRLEVSWPCLSLQLFSGLNKHDFYSFCGAALLHPE